MPLVVQNTLTGKKEEFKPLKDGIVNMYVCGITPYDESHIGHARCYVVFDVIRRYLKYKNYDVSYVQNYTDIDDKIIKRANDLNVSIEELVDKNIKKFEEVMEKLNVLDADEYPRVTEHIKDIIKTVETLIEKDYAYEVDGTVYFAVDKFKDYGKLSKRKREDMAAGARVEVDEAKKNPLDFALWKKAKEGEPSWPSPPIGCHSDIPSEPASGAHFTIKAVQPRCSIPRAPGLCACLPCYSMTRTVSEPAKAVPSL